MKSTIAIVDDDWRVLESLEDLLESAGHSVRPFSSAQSFLDTGALREVDCVIADVSMPDIDGLELQRCVRAARTELPIIFITARYEAGEEARAASQGHQGFLRKPFDATELLATVCRVLGPHGAAGDHDG